MEENSKYFERFFSYRYPPRFWRKKSFYGTFSESSFYELSRKESFYEGFSEPSFYGLSHKESFYGPSHNKSFYEAFSEHILMQARLCVNHSMR
jgi:hypothetical protein